MNDFVQLCTFTAYSFGESIVSIDEYVDRASELGYKYIAICDKTLRAYPSFADACFKKGITPIYGIRIDLRIDGVYPLKAYLYIENETGYLNICKLLRAKSNNYGIEELAKSSDGLKLVIQADNADFFQPMYLTMISKQLQAYRKLFKEQVFFGITINNKEDFKEINELYEFCDRQEIKTIAFPEVRYLNKQDGKYLDILKCAIDKTNYEEHDKAYPYFLLAPSALNKIFRQEDINNSFEFVKDISFNFFEKRGDIIKFDDDDNRLKTKVMNGLERKLGNIPDEYKKRADHELKIIQEMNFSSYFLVVEDYVRFAKSNGIVVGPGRGSAAGSLVSYALSITEVDPILFNLSFERFLNPKRLSMPDIDIDFEDTRRNEVVEYLKDTYGVNRVATIRTYGTLKPKSSINLIGPTLGVNERRLKKLTSSISNYAEDFKQAEKDYALGHSFSKIIQDSYYKNICEVASHYIGLPVNLSFHAPGVILSDKDISLTCPREDGRIGTVEYEYGYMERMGFLKMDILSLKTLTFIKEVEAEIKRDGFSLPDIIKERNDSLAYELIRKRHLACIFQFDENDNVKNYIDMIKPTCFDDIAALSALNRPGPKANIPLFARLKNGEEKIIYPDERLRPILEETYGIIVYQEQILRIVQELAGFSPSDADLFRRAISKKKISEMQKYEDDFIIGCKKNGISKETALRIYSDIEKFAEYGFNKAHTYCYTFISFKIAYYKAHFPNEFYRVALKENSLSSKDGQNLIKELSDNGIRIMNPSINDSCADEFVFKGSKCYPPLTLIQGANREIIQKIIDIRGNEVFKNLYDFCKRTISLFKDNSAIVASLIDSGAFDCIDKNRTGMKSSINQYFGFAMMHFPEDQIPILSKANEPLGKILMNEKTKLGSILSVRLDHIARKNGYRTLIVSDVIEYGKDDVTLKCDDNYNSYQVRKPSDVNVAKYDFVLIQEQYFRKSKTIYPDSILIVKQKR